MAHTLNQSQREEIQAELALREKLWTPEKFLIGVEAHAERFDLGIIESVIEFCNENELDVEFAAKELMSPKLYGLIEEDAEERRLIKGRKTKLKFT